MSEPGKPNSEPGSISLLLRDLQEGGTTTFDAASGQIYDRYFRVLSDIARRHTAPGRGREADEEDFASAALVSFFKLFDGGRPAGVGNRAELLERLVVITKRKTADHFRRANAKKRGSGAPALTGTGPDDSELLSGIPDERLSHEWLVQLRDVVDFLWSTFPLGDDHRRVLELWLQGESVSGTAEVIRTSRRTVGRLRDTIVGCVKKYAEREDINLFPGG